MSRSENLIDDLINWESYQKPDTRTSLLALLKSLYFIIIIMANCEAVKEGHFVGLNYLRKPSSLTVASGGHFPLRGTRSYSLLWYCFTQLHMATNTWENLDLCQKRRFVLLFWT